MYNQFSYVLQYHPSCHQNAKVVVVVEGKHWHIPDHVKALVQYILNPMERVSLGEGEDSWAWTVTRSGEYRMKETYETVRKRKMEVEWYNIVGYKNRIRRHALSPGLQYRVVLKQIIQLGTD